MLGNFDDNCGDFCAINHLQLIFFYLNDIEVDTLTSVSETGDEGEAGERVAAGEATLGSDGDEGGDVTGGDPGLVVSAAGRSHCVRLSAWFT